MSETVLEVVDLSKRYKNFSAVDGISFTVPRGSVLGLLGPNGAGKTTTIQMLMGITEPTGGTISYFGKNFATNKPSCLQRINYTSAYNELLGGISVRENLTVFARLYNVRDHVRKIDELAEYFEITQLFDQRFFQLSAGQRTRVNIAKALLNDPELVMMDEPTASLDPDIRDKVMSLIENARRQRNLSILFTSHNMEEVARICDEVILLSKGRIVRRETPENLAAEVRAPLITLAFRGSPEAIVTAINGTHPEIEVSTDSDEQISFTTETARIPSVLGALDGGTEFTILDIDIRKPSLEEAFLYFARGGEQR